jgi:lipopolysaccharide/colanic/teichoic acid biosynthesis glycosyltransferase
MRRAVDVVVSATALVLMAVPLAIVALLVSLSSQGPGLFRQRRVGRDGKIFWLYKVRSMRAAQVGPAVTSAGDLRITRLGRLLRRWKIDELPQFGNVLRGDLSLVGPRPEVETFVNGYTPAQRRILQVTPGLAGMAQLVYAHESELLQNHPDPEHAYINHLLPRKIAVDLAYERTRTFASDLRLMGELVLTIAGRRRYIDTSLELPTARALHSG